MKFFQIGSSQTSKAEMKCFYCNGQEEQEEPTKSSNYDVSQEGAKSFIWRSWRLEYSGLRFICKEKGRAKA